MMAFDSTNLKEVQDAYFKEKRKLDQAQERIKVLEKVVVMLANSDQHTSILHLRKLARQALTPEGSADEKG